MAHCNFHYNVLHLLVLTRVYIELVQHKLNSVWYSAERINYRISFEYNIDSIAFEVNGFPDVLVISKLINLSFRSKLTRKFDILCMTNTKTPSFLRYFTFGNDGRGECLRVEDLSVFRRMERRGQPSPRFLSRNTVGGVMPHGRWVAYNSASERSERS